MSDKHHGYHQRSAIGDIVGGLGTSIAIAFQSAGQILSQSFERSDNIVHGILEGPRPFYRPNPRRHQQQHQHGQHQYQQRQNRQVDRQYYGPRNTTEHPPPYKCSAPYRKHESPPAYEAGEEPPAYSGSTSNYGKVQVASANQAPTNERSLPVNSESPSAYGEAPPAYTRPKPAASAKHLPTYNESVPAYARSPSNYPAFEDSPPAYASVTPSYSASAPAYVTSRSTSARPGYAPADGTKIPVYGYPPCYHYKYTDGCKYCLKWQWS